MDTVAAVVGDVSQSVEFSGTVRKPETLTLGFLSSGRIARVDVVAGDYVDAGDSLAALEGVTFANEAGELVTEQEVLRSPINGIVVEVFAQRGELAAIGQPMVMVETAAQEFVIDVYIPETDVAAINARRYAATVVLDAFDDVTFVGTLTHVAPAATVIEGVAYYRATVTLDGRAGDGKGFDGVRTGMSATVSVITAEADDVLVIPYRAVLRDGDKKTVRVVTDDKTGDYVLRDVTLGLRGDNGMIAVREGLTEGDVVVVSIDEE